MRTDVTTAMLCLFAGLGFGCGGSVSGPSDGLVGGAGNDAAAPDGSAGSQGRAGSAGDPPIRQCRCESYAPCCTNDGKRVEPLCDSDCNSYCPNNSSWPEDGLCLPKCGPSTPCPAHGVCDYYDRNCEKQLAGKCKAGANACTARSDFPVCTCDGTVAANACLADEGAMGIRSAGGCPSPAGMFPCGANFCQSGKEYCLVGINAKTGMTDSYYCSPIPATCGQPLDCLCTALSSCSLSSQSRGCKASAAGDLTVECR